MGILQSFVRLMLIAVATLIVVAVVLFSLRQLGLREAPILTANPLLQQSFFLFARGDSDKAPPFSANGFVAALEASKKTVLVVDLRPTKDMQWVVYGRASLDEYTDGHGSVEALSAGEVQQLVLKPISSQASAAEPSHIMTLGEFLARFPEQRLAFVIHSRESIGAAALLDQLRSRESVAETLIMSPYHSMVRELRRQRPNWIFASDPATVARLRFMSALFIETLTDIWPDIISTPLRVTKSVTISPRLAEELSRRHKPLVIETDGQEEIPPYLKQAMRGVLTGRAGWAAREFAAQLAP